MPSVEDRVRGIVERCDHERHYGFVLRRNGLGVAYGKRIFFHVGSMRVDGCGPLTLPPAGAFVTFLLTRRPDGRRWIADDVAVESVNLENQRLCRSEGGAE